MSAPLLSLAVHPRRVEQREHDDCAVACLAMVTGLPYDDARAALAEAYRPPRGTRTWRFKEALARLGYAVAEARGEGGPRAAVNVANVLCERGQLARTKLAHFVVLLADGRVLDPAPGGERRTRLSDFHRVRSVAAVVPFTPDRR